MRLLIIINCVLHMFVRDYIDIYIVKLFMKCSIYKIIEVVRYVTNHFAWILDFGCRR